MFTSTLIYFFPHSASYFFNQQLSKYMDENEIWNMFSYIG